MVPFVLLHGLGPDLVGSGIRLC